MCGIAGVYFKKSICKSTLGRFQDLVKEKQASRGPDDFGSLQISENLFFFHNRLSIIDLNASFQPIHDENGVLVYNGEIYNYQNLLVDGNVSKSDTHYLLKALGNGNLDFLNNTNSMFGFCYYQKISGKLILARDRIGIKQLYYIDNEDVFAFASTLAPLVVFSQKVINAQALPSYYLNRAFKAPNTIFKDIKCLEPGHSVEFNIHFKSLDSIKTWWKRSNIENKIFDENKIISEVDELIHQSVQNRLVSDVPVGVYLSGGVDSSLITAIASKYNSSIETFTVSFKDQRFDESKYAKAVANQYNVKYNEIVMDERDFVNAIDDWIISQDDIVADPSAIALNKISQLAKECGFKVMLAGEGADELFAGYNSYNRFLKSKKYHNYLRLLKPFSNSISNLFSSDSRKKHFIYNTIENPVFYGTALIFEPHLLNELFNENILLNSVSTLNQALNMDILDRIPNDLLVRTDRATMNASIECRVPFLAHQIVDYTSKIDERLFLKNGVQKYLLKKIAEKYIPLENINRKKVGFDLPIDDWFRGPLKDKMYELIENSIQIDILEISKIKVLFENHLKRKINASGKLWAFMSLELNYRYLVEIK